MARRRPRMWSTSSRTGLPRCSAVSTIFSPCWSVPVTKQASLAAAALPARQHVGHARRVGVTDVGLGVDVVDGRRDVIGVGSRAALRAARAARARRPSGDSRCAAPASCAPRAVRGTASSSRRRDRARRRARARATRSRSTSRRGLEQRLHRAGRVGTRAAVLLRPVEELRARRSAPASIRARSDRSSRVVGRSASRLGSRDAGTPRAGSASARSRAGRPRWRRRARSVVRGGGSSSSRSSAFCASAFSHSASAITAARRPPRASAGAAPTAAHGSDRYARACRLRRARPRAGPGDRRRGAARGPLAGAVERDRRSAPAERRQSAQASQGRGPLHGRPARDEGRAAAAGRRRGRRADTPSGCGRSQGSGREGRRGNSRRHSRRPESSHQRPGRRCRRRAACAKSRVRPQRLLSPRAGRRAAPARGPGGALRAAPGAAGTGPAQGKPHRAVVVHAHQLHVAAVGHQGGPEAVEDGLDLRVERVRRRSGLHRLRIGGRPLGFTRWPR